MTGWRLGWLVAPERYVDAIDRIAQNVFLAASTPSQYAALAAFEPVTLALLDARRDEFRARRDFLLPALRALGFGVPQKPRGAFLSMPTVLPWLRTVLSLRGICWSRRGWPLRRELILVTMPRTST